MNLNNVSIIGRVTRDPESRNTPSGTVVVTFSVATNYKFKDKNGNVDDKTSFHNCVAFGKLASEVIAKYCFKGQEVFVGGRLDYQEWQKKDGTKANKTQIIVEDFQLGQKPNASGSGGVAGGNGKYQEKEESFDITGEEEVVTLENIPF